MLPFGLQPLHLVIIAVVALLIFGPSKLPELGRGMGKAITEFRKGIKGGIEESQSADQPAQSPLTTPNSQAQQVIQPGVQSLDNSAASVFCNQCGSPNPKIARFCNKCGAPIT